MNRSSSAVPSSFSRRFTSHLVDPLYRTSYLLILGGGVTAVAGFVFWIVAARTYPARTVGVNSAAISGMMFVSGVCQLGLPAVLLRYVPLAGHRTRAIVARSYALTAGISLVFGAVAALTSGLWPPALSFLGREPGWLIGFAVATAAWTVFTLQDGVLTGLRAAHWVPIENSLFSIAKLILLLAFASVVPFSGLFVAWNLPAVLAVVAITILIFRQLIPAQEAPPSGEQFDGRRLVRLAAGNYIAQLFGIAAIFLMPVIVAGLTSATTTAYFYAPWTIASALQLVAGNTANSLTVEAALAENDLAHLCRRTLNHTMRLLLPVTTIVILGAPILLRAYGPRYAYAGSSLLRLLALGAIPNAIVALGLAVARIEQNGRAVLAIQAAECLPLLALSILLLPSQGIEGVGVAYLLSQIAVASWLLRFNLRQFLFRRHGSRTNVSQQSRFEGQVSTDPPSRRRWPAGRRRRPRDRVSPLQESASDPQRLAELESQPNVDAAPEALGDTAGPAAACARVDASDGDAGSPNPGELIGECDRAGAQAADRGADKPGDAADATSLGVLLEQQGDVVGAKAAYRRATERGDAVGSFNLGVLLEAEGDLAGATLAYCHADERGHAAAASNLGVLLETQSDVAGARAAFRRAGERGDAIGSFNLGVLLEEQGDLAGARAAYSQAQAQAHGDADVARIARTALLDVDRRMGDS